MCSITDSIIVAEHFAEVAVRFIYYNGVANYLPSLLWSCGLVNKLEKIQTPFVAGPFLRFTV